MSAAMIRYQWLHGVPTETVSTVDTIAPINKLLAQLSETPSYFDGQILGLLDRKRCTMVLLAYDGKNIIGMASLCLLCKLSGLYGTIEDVVVDKNYQGKGVGKTLVERLLSSARGLGMKQVDLTSNPSRVAANALYRKLGFKRRKTNAYRYTF